jgi:hypothetical protein
MEDQRIGVWPQPEARGGFSLLRNVQTGSEEISFSCLVGTGRVCLRGMKLITHLHLVLRLRMTGATSPLFQTPSWRGKAAFGWNCEVHINGATRAMRGYTCSAGLHVQCAVQSGTWHHPSIWKCFDRFVRSQDLPDACRHLTSRPTFNYTNPNDGPHMCSCLFLTDLCWLCQFTVCSSGTVKI